MYSEEDINSAIEAGALSEDAAASFRAHMSEVRGISRGDEENFRLLNSFNDIFVAIGIAIMLFAAGAIGQQLGKMLVPPPDWNWDANLTNAQFEALGRQQSFSTAVSVAIAAGLVAVTSWPLAEFFTRARRMALTGAALDAETAKDWGLAMETFAEDELIDGARAIAAEMIANSTAPALAAMKRQFDFAATATLDEALRDEARVQAELVLTEESRKLIDSFGKR